MPVDHREIAFEKAIEHHLLNEAGYTSASAADFDRERAMDPTVFIPFLKETQPQAWEYLENLHGAETENIVLDDLGKAMDSQGALAVVRHGFKCFGRKLHVATPFKLSVLSLVLRFVSIGVVRWRRVCSVVRRCVLAGVFWGRVYVFEIDECEHCGPIV